MNQTKMIFKKIQNPLLLKNSEQIILSRDLGSQANLKHKMNNVFNHRINISN